MNTIKITSKKTERGFVYTGTYHGVDRDFVFQTQTSAPPIKYKLTKGAIIEIDVEACRNRDIVIVDGVYHMEGVWYNFYKDSQNTLLTFCVTLTDKI